MDGSSKYYGLNFVAFSEKDGSCRSRAVTKPGLMADHTSHRQNYCATSAPIPSLFGSPKFRELSTKCVCASGFEAFTLRTPTSILDSRALNQLSLSPIGFSHQPQPQPIPISSKGLALLTSLQIQQNSNVLFGTQLGVKIPTPPSSKEGQSVMCWSEMENCEEYTCVKSGGPNPTTTHIFHNCIILIHTTPHHNTYSSFDSASTTTTNFLTITTPIP
ncbi:protein MARD1 [Senna tora]|uniref:Protein MARD1 n=1 Tax=Senna tora TaxID=362788 RepID=A0A834STQ9_9FABA|nr:protein MARD1 [Senna tora]